MELWETASSGPGETRSLGRCFGELAMAGLVVLLNGDLGAGKTSFAQGVGVGLSIPRSSPVTSPSYTLLNIHMGRIPLYHFDLYRLSRVDDLADLGYDEYAEGTGLTLVEWADRMATPLPCDIEVSITRKSESERQFVFASRSIRGRDFLCQLAANAESCDKPA